MSPNWETVGIVELEDCGAIQLGRGKVISKTDLAGTPGNYPVYSSAKENDGKFGEYGEYMFDEELITWSVDGGGRLFHRPRHRFSITNVGGFVRILDASVVDCRYLFHVLSYLHGQVQFDWVRKAHPSVIRQVYTDFPLPPLDEQKRIVAKLNQAFAALDRARVNAERNLKETELLYEASVDAKINGGRVGWQSGTIQSLVGDVFTGPFGSLLHKRDYVAGGTPIVNPSNIVGGTVEPDWNKTVSMEGSRRLDSYKLRSGDLVLGRRGEMGRCAPISEEMDGWLCGTGSFIIRPKVGVSVAFVGHLMRSRRIVDRLSAIATGATMPNLSNQALAKMSFELPEKPQQIRLLAEIERLQETAESLGAAFRSKLADIAALRQSLLHAAFSGQLI